MQLTFCVIMNFNNDEKTLWLIWKIRQKEIRILLASSNKATKREINFYTHDQEMKHNFFDAQTSPGFIFIERTIHLNSYNIEQTQSGLFKNSEKEQTWSALKLHGSRIL